MSNQSMEIERVFVIDHTGFNPAESKEEQIRQGYLAIGEGGEEVRIREKGAHFRLAYKRGTGRDRTELEIDLTEEQFDLLWPGTEGRRLLKTRYTMSYGALVLEIDIFEGPLKGLALAEIEFENREQAEAFERPGWFLAEVTEDPRFKNQNLATAEEPPEVC